MAAKTLFEKIWEEHVVREKTHEPSLLYIDLHLVHEVTSPQAFEGLRHSGRKVRAPHRTFATQDHNVPTTDRSKPITDMDSKLQIETLRRNCAEFGLKLFDIGSREQGIVHVIGPELGLTQPGMTIVCGDSHTATQAALRGPAIEALSMEERMTVCNMSIEGGARAGMVAADKTTVEYLRGRRYVATGKDFDQLAARWLACRRDDSAELCRSVT